MSVLLFAINSDYETATARQIGAFPDMENAIKFVWEEAFLAISEIWIDGIVQIDSFLNVETVFELDLVKSLRENPKRSLFPKKTLKKNYPITVFYAGIVETNTFPVTDANYVLINVGDK